MKKIVCCVLLLLFLIATVYSQATPSLEDTLVWLKKYIELYGVYTHEHPVTGAQSVNPVTFNYKTGDSQITITGHRYSSDDESTTVFQLNELKPEIDIVLLKRGYYRLWFCMNESKDLIKITMKQIQGSERGTTKIYYESSEYIDFKDKSIADRVAAAFINAILKAKEKEIF